MDLFQKAKKSALALKSEVQGIINTPGQQPGSYGYNPSQSSYNQSSPSYPQYSQTDPQVQNFQSQYAAPVPNPSQSGQPQSYNPMAPGSYQNVPSNQYNGPIPGGQQSPGVAGQQQFQPVQYGHSQNQQHQYQPVTPIGNQQYLSSQAQPQHQPARVHNLIAPPWDPNAQNNVSAQPYQQHPPSAPPGNFQGHQPSNAPPGSLPILHSQSFPSIVQPYSPPPVPQPYSSPPIAQPYSTSQVPQGYQNQSGYFPSGQQNQSVNQVTQQQASSFMQNFVAPTQNQHFQNQPYHGPQTPPQLPLGNPPLPQNTLHQGFQNQDVMQPSQTPPLPPRQNTCPPPQQFHSNQGASMYGQAPQQNVTSFAAQQHNQHQPYQESQQESQKYPNSQHSSGPSHQASESFSQPPPAYHTIEGQPLLGKLQQFVQQNIAHSTPLSSPPIQNTNLPPHQGPPSQEHNIVPQPSRFSPRPVEQRPPPKQDIQSAVSQPQHHTQPLQQYIPITQPLRLSPKPVEQIPPPRQDSQSVPLQSQPQKQPLQQHYEPTQPLRFSPRPVEGQTPRPPAQPIQQPSVVSQPSRFSPRPVAGQMPPPRHKQHQQQAKPLQMPTASQTQTPVTPYPSSQSTEERKPSFNQQRIPSPSAVIESRRSPVQALPNNAPRPTQNPTQGNKMPISNQGGRLPQQSQSRPPIQTSQSSPTTHAPVSSKSQPKQTQVPPRKTTSPPYPVDNHESFNPTTTESAFSKPYPSVVPAPLHSQSQPSHSQKPPRQNTSPPIVEQFQVYNQMTGESASQKPAPLNLQSGANRTGTPPIYRASPPPSKQHQTFKPPTTQGRASPPSQASQTSPVGQYQAFRPTESSALHPAPLQPSQQVPPRQETISPPIQEYKAFSQKLQSPASNYTAFKPPGSRAEQAQFLPPKSTTPPQISPIQSPAPTTSQVRPQNQGQQLPYQVSPQLQQSRPAYGHPQSFQMPTPPPVSQSPHARMVSPLSPSQKAPSFPQVFEMDSGDPVLSTPQGRPSFPSSQSGPIEFADGLISVEHEDSNPALLTQHNPSNHATPVQQHFNHVQAGTDLNSQASKTKCVGFEATLTDVNEFFEIHPAIVSQHGIQYKFGRDFVICEYCYHTFIAPHPSISNQFRPRPKGPQADESLPISFEKMRGCGLAFPRIRQTILSLAIPQRNIQPLVEYLLLDATLSPCTGEPQTGSYFGTKAIEALVLCKSCFESFVKNTGFERNFSLIQTAPGQRWGCDWSDNGYLSRVLLTDLAKNPPDFPHFALQANKRLAMPPCNGHKQPIAASGLKRSTIFRSVKDNQGVFCSAHFYDLVVGTSAERGFGYEIEIDDEQKQGLSCDLPFPFSINNMTKAVRLLDYQIWYLPIVASNTTYPCPIAGHDEGNLEALGSPPWYQLPSHPTVEICARCYGTEVVPSQATHLFQSITRALTPGRIRQCHFSPSTTTEFSSSPMSYENTLAFRGHYLRSILSYCNSAGNDFTFFLDAATYISSIPPACGSNLRSFRKPSGRKWFGHQASHSQDATIIICAECHDFAVKNTQLEEIMGNDLTAYAYSTSPTHGVRCATCSKQTKIRLRQACERGDFAAFTQYYRQREELFNRLSQAVKELDVLNGLLAHRTGKKMDLGLSELMGRLGLEPQEGGDMPGLNMVMWEMASVQRLVGEVERRVEAMEGLRGEWVVLE